MTSKKKTKPLAVQVKAWRGDHGMPAHEAAALLGIPKRTLDGIEQGRKFRYEQLLLLALKAAPVPAEPA
jgi:DNA-binding XRE family transcriptional regulator